MVYRTAYYNIALSWCHKNLNAYCFYRKTEDEFEHQSFSRWYATNRNVKGLTQDETKPYFIKKVSDCKNIKTTPYKQDIYKGQPKFKGWDMSKFKED